MIFEVIGPDGISKMSTTSISCIYSIDILTQMQSSGYRFRLDDKLISLSKLKAFLNEGNIESNNTNTSKKIRCVDTGEIFENQSKAARYYNIDPAQVSDSIKTGRRRSGYIFEKI